MRILPVFKTASLFLVSFIVISILLTPVVLANPIDSVKIFFTNIFDSIKGFFKGTEETTSLSIRPPLSCVQDFDCPQVVCVREPCPQYQCIDGRCDLNIVESACCKFTDIDGNIRYLFYPRDKCVPIANKIVGTVDKSFCEPPTTTTTLPKCIPELNRFCTKVCVPRNDMLGRRFGLKTCRDSCVPLPCPTTTTTLPQKQVCCQFINSAGKTKYVQFSAYQCVTTPDLSASGIVSVRPVDDKFCQTNVCGNSVCEIGENYLNCPVDCLPPTTTTTLQDDALLIQQLTKKVDEQARIINELQLTIKQQAELINRLINELRKI